MGDLLEAEAITAAPTELKSEHEHEHDAGLHRDESPPEHEATQQPPAKKKQKRNKPTLSCAECVERKTKCDRNRPTCWACLKRQSSCRYSEVANIIAAAASTSSSNGNPTARKPAPKRVAPGKLAAHYVDPTGAQPSIAETLPSAVRRTSTTPSFTSLPLLLADLPHLASAPSKIFGEGSKHPFSNYWTCQGGLAEVIGVLPSKEQADILVAKYFEAIDPVYPMINKHQFLSDYNHFWARAPSDKASADPALVGLHCTIYAISTQFIQLSSEQERQQVAEFYASAAHQALRISSYLNSGSIYTVQAIVLLCYFLMNDNKASDAWGFGGILVRHVYAMGLNRDPELVVPEASVAEKQQRRKLWQAVMFQDTFLTVLLKLPPTTTFSDVSVDSLIDDPDVTPSPELRTRSPPVNPMSISSIAPSPSTHTTSSANNTPPPTSSNDTSFIRHMWRLANFVQARVCTPRALSQPMASSVEQRVQVVTSFRALYDSFPTALNSFDPMFFHQLASRNPRQARQNLFLRSNFWHCMMLILADDAPRYGVARDVSGAIDAGRQGMLAFFNLWDYFKADAKIWWVFQHRAFEEALTVAEMLAARDAYGPVTPAASGLSPVSVSPDTLLTAAKRDVCRVLEILEHVGNSGPEMQKTRLEVLRGAVENINW